MPPKRKRATDPDPEEAQAVSTRSTRASTRAKSTTSAAAAKEKPIPKAKPTSNKTSSKSKKTEPEHEPESEDEVVEDEPKAVVAATRKRKSSSATAAAKPTTRGKTSTNERADATAKKENSNVVLTENPAKKSKPDLVDLKPGTYTDQRAENVFSTYMDDDVEPASEPAISTEGIMRLCENAGISMEGVQPILLAWVCKSKKMAHIDKSEWMQGMRALKIDSVPKLGVAMSDIEKQLYAPSAPKLSAPSDKDLYNKTLLLSISKDRDAVFKDFYTFVFDLVKGSQRNIDIETATALWEAVLKPKYAHIKDIISFIEEKNADEQSKAYKGITKDQWKMTLLFLTTVESNLSNYDAEGEWPTMLDAFVEWKKAKIPDT